MWMFVLFCFPFLSSWQIIPALSRFGVDAAMMQNTKWNLYLSSMSMYIYQTDNVFFVLHRCFHECVFFFCESDSVSIHIFSISKVRRQVNGANKLHIMLPWQGRTLFANSLEVGDTYSWLMDRPSGSHNAARWKMSATWAGSRGACAEKNGFCASKHRTVWKATANTH